MNRFLTFSFESFHGWARQSCFIFNEAGENLPGKPSWYSEFVLPVSSVSMPTALDVICRSLNSNHSSSINFFEFLYCLFAFHFLAAVNFVLSLCFWFLHTSLWLWSLLSSWNILRFKFQYINLFFLWVFLLITLFHSHIFKLSFIFPLNRKKITLPLIRHTSICIFDSSICFNIKNRINIVTWTNNFHFPIHISDICMHWGISRGKNNLPTWYSCCEFIMSRLKAGWEKGICRSFFGKIFVWLN